MPDATYPLFFRLRGGPPGDSPMWHRNDEGMWVRYCMEHRVQHTEHYYSHDLRNGVHPQCAPVRGKSPMAAPVEFGPVGTGPNILREDPDNQLVKHCTTTPVDGQNPIRGLMCEDMRPHLGKSCPAVQAYMSPALCEGCDIALPAEARVSETWCKSCLSHHRRVAAKARDLRRMYPVLAKNHTLSLGIAALVLGEYGKRPFVNRIDFLDIQSTLTAAAQVTPPPVIRPKLNLRQVVQGVNESTRDRSLARRLTANLVPVTTNEKAPAPKLHQMVVHPVVSSRKYGERVAYYSRCLECDAYSSKYWDRKDCPTEHAVEDYTL